mgnify:CR=1 FL=1
MKSVYNFVIKPKGERYNNKKSIGDKELILNTEMFNHQFVNREAEVISCPIIGDDLGIKPGDTVIVHHNVFRRWENVRGEEKNSKAYFNDSTYLVYKDQIFLYKNNGSWKAPAGYCFVKPIKETKMFSINFEKEGVGIVKYTDGVVEKNSLVGFNLPFVDSNLTESTIPPRPTIRIILPLSLQKGQGSFKGLSISAIV